MGKIKCVNCGEDISGRGVHCPECGKYAVGVRTTRNSPMKIKAGVRTTSTFPMKIKVTIKKYWLHLLFVFIFTILYHALPFFDLPFNGIINSILQAIIQILLTVLLIIFASQLKQLLEGFFPFLKDDD